MRYSTPLISIITVCFNAVHTIDRTFQSILNQTYQNIEYIVIDGGSTDGTLDVVAKYNKIISCLVSEKDKGIYDAMNKGIRLAHGDVIGIINADDFYATDALEQVMSIFRTNTDLDVVLGNCAYINQSEKLLSTAIPHIDFKNVIVHVHHPSTFVSRHCYEKYGVFDKFYCYAGDYEFFCRLTTNNATFFHINTTLASYRIGGFGTKVGIIGEKECFLITYKYWGLFVACCKVPQFLYLYLRRKLGFFFRKFGLLKPL